MKRNIRRILSVILMALASVNAFSQTSKDKSKILLWGNPVAFYNTQLEQSLNIIDKALTENPPTTEFSLVRKLALYNLDAILHETKYDKSEALQRFICSRISDVINDFSTPIKKGIKIYKIYNDGFIVRSKSTVFAFDLCGKKGTIVPDSLMQLLVDKCEVLFISHAHDDHADFNVVNMFAKEGKPIYAPTNLWPDNKAINHVRSEQVVNKQIELHNKTVSFNIYPGHQSDLINNVYVVTLPEKITVAQMGDQYNADDMAWIENMYKQNPLVDVLIVDCWTYKMEDVADGFKPKLLIIGHENEMGHTIDHREPFWLTYHIMENIKVPYLIMGWGEWYNYKK